MIMWWQCWRRCGTNRYIFVSFHKFPLNLLVFLFDISLTLDKEPLARDEMSEEAFYEMMAKGLEQAKKNDSRAFSDVIANIKRDIREWTK